MENVLWANTVLAAGSAVGLVVYTGKETRAVLNTSEPETKMGTLEMEVNKMAKVTIDIKWCSADCRSDSVYGHLCTVHLPCRLKRVSRPMVHICLSFPHSVFFDYSYQVSNKELHCGYSPDTSSLRVNLDMGKSFYSRQIQRDPEIPDTIVRTSTLPEELGRVEYLLTDKTGTLTRNGK